MGISHPKCSLTAHQTRETQEGAGFNFALVEQFAKSVREAIGWVEGQDPLCQVRKYIINLSKEPESFPYIEELEELIQDEWQKSVKKSCFTSRLSKLPLKEPKINILLSAPMVDASKMHLAWHVTLPMEYAVTFKDDLDCKMDLDLKKAYTATAGL